VPILLGDGEWLPDHGLCVLDLLEAPQNFFFGITEINPAEKPERLLTYS
jgi:hypothetical protein